MIIRCSELDMLFACPPSVLSKERRILTRDYEHAANLGKAAHFMAASHIETGSYDMDIALSRYGLKEEDVEELAGLMAYAEKAWLELKKYFPKPQTECSMKAPICAADELHGTGDCVSFVGDKAAVFIDWKSGYLDDDYTNQMLGYAYCLWESLGQPKDVSIMGVVVFLRHKYYRVLKFTAESLSDWYHDLTYNVLPNSSSYKPAKQCAFCGLSDSCQARQEVARSTLKALMFGVGDKDDKDYETWLDKALKIMPVLDENNKKESVVGELVSDVLFRIKLAEQAAAKAKLVLREAVLRAGPIPLPDGDVLALRPVERRSLNALKAFPILRKRMSDKEICLAMKLSLPEIIKSHVKTMPKKEKKLAREQLMNELADTIQTTNFDRMEIMKSTDIQEKDDAK